MQRGVEHSDDWGCGKGASKIKGGVASSLECVKGLCSASTGHSTKQQQQQSSKQRRA